MSDTKSKDRKIEIIATIMLGIIMVAISWSSYQSHLWSGVQTFLLRDVNKDSLDVTKKELQQGQYSAVDLLTFTQYSNALIRKDQNLTNFYYERFRPEMRVAVDAWLKTDPLNNPDAPATPFAMSEYNKTYAIEAQQSAQKTELELQQAQQANENSSNYVLLTVIYSSALFIDGIIGRTSTRKIGLILLAMTLVITIVATVALLQLPLARSIQM